MADEFARIDRLERLEEQLDELKCIVRERDNMIGENASRISRLDQLFTAQAKDIEDMGGSLDHVINTVDSLIIPTQKSHAEKIERHDRETSEAHDYIRSQQGAWSFIQKAGIVIAALSSVIVLCMKVWGKG